VRAATFEGFAPLVGRAGLEFAPLPGDAEGLLKTVGSGGIENAQSVPQMIAALRRSYGTLAAALPDAILEATRGSEMILNQLPGNLFGPDLAEYYGIPLGVVSVIPLVPTRTRPLFAFPRRPGFLPGYNRATYWLGQQAAWQMFRAATNRLRRQTLGLPARDFWGSGLTGWPAVCGYSAKVVPTPVDWPHNAWVTGWWQPTDPAWSPPEALLSFLDAGSPPVFIGFGSMPVRDPQATARMVVEAVGQTGQRAILHAGWAGLRSDHLPPEIYPMTYAPYGWLFPRMAGLIHHGGSGTTGFALSSGVPSCVVPFLFDQFYWGERSAALGVGPKPLPFRKITANRMAACIADLADGPSYRACAAGLGDQLRQEQGILEAVRIIENLGASSPMVLQARHDFVRNGKDQTGTRSRDSTPGCRSDSECSIRGCWVAGGGARQGRGKGLRQSEMIASALNPTYEEMEDWI
jgi:UDP:flavonoid glycosyltransferase YjiC (YdhE family)